MARIAGVNIPTNKRVEIALTYIHGIGDAFAQEICEKVSIPSERRVNELTESEVIQIRETIDRDYVVEGDLRRGSVDEYQASHGLRVLSRLAASPWSAGTWPAYTHQRAHAERTGEADRR